MAWTMHVATVGAQERCTQGFGGGDLGERNNLRDPGVDRKIILKCVFRDIGWV
jgi:hypothetical protein